MGMQFESESVKQIEKAFFKKDMYYSIDPSRKDYKSNHPLYKCIYSSPFGGLLQSFNETGEFVGEHFVPHSAKRYVISDLNEDSLRKQHYSNFIQAMNEEAEEHQKLADKLRKEVEIARLTLASWGKTL